MRCGKKGMRPNFPTDDGDVFRTVRNRGKEKAATSVPPSLPTSLTLYRAISAPSGFIPVRTALSFPFTASVVSDGDLPIPSLTVKVPTLG